MSRRGIGKRHGRWESLFGYASSLLLLDFGGALQERPRGFLARTPFRALAFLFPLKGEEYLMVL